MADKREADSIIDFIIDGFRIIVVAAISFYVVFKIIGTLAGDLPA